MYLGVYSFSGDPETLLRAYDKLVAMMPADNLQWHMCTQVADGIVVYDTCPSEEVFIGFSTSPQFRGGLEAAGLPEPTITGQAVYAARAGSPRE